MFRKETIALIKFYQKLLAQELREAKKLIHQPHTYKEQWAVRSLKRTYRHRHIAYCLLRGKTLEQIEVPHEDNQAEMSTVNGYMDKFQRAFEVATHEERCKLCS